LDPDEWKARSAAIEEFIRAVGALPSPDLRSRLTSTGPYADLLATRDALNAFVDAVRESGKMAREWVTNVVFASRPSRAAVELPLPPGNRMQPVISGGQLNTRIELRRSSPSRKIGDSIRMQYSFSDGQTVLPGGWTDEFSLQSYGWQSDVIASLAFARQAHAPTWKPTAAMNWILSRNAWPTAGQSGLASSELKWFSGAGFSVMPLNAANGQDVQVGLGLTLAFLNNRILVGYGSNLQSEKDKGFAFFSIRVLDFPGLSGPLGTSGVSR
jgi:hypothetical protein